MGREAVKNPTTPPRDVVHVTNVVRGGEPKFAADLVPRFDPRKDFFLCSNGQSFATELVAAVNDALVPMLPSNQIREEI